MPHIIVEATPKLGNDLNFAPLFASIHDQIASTGHARRDDFKSRVLILDRHLAGADRSAEFIVARLVTTHPRPQEVLRAMAQLIHDILEAAIVAEARPFWWQCCVLIETVDPLNYFKTDSQASAER